MAVHIKLIKNNIKSSSSYGKYFAKTVSQGEDLSSIIIIFPPSELLWFHSFQGCKYTKNS